MAVRQGRSRVIATYLYQPHDRMNVYAHRKQRLVNDSTQRGWSLRRGARDRIRNGTSGARYIAPAWYSADVLKTQYANGESMMCTNRAVISNASAGRATARPIVASTSAERFQHPSKMSSWEKLLDSIGIPEGACTSLIRCRSQKGRA